MKRTWQPRGEKVRKHGFRKRMKKNYNVIMRRRRSKGRYKLTV